MNLPAGCVGFCAAWVATAGVWAAPLDVTVALERSAYDAREQFPSSSFVLNRESGMLSGGTLAVSMRGGDGGCDAFLRGLSGGLDYRGLTQFGLPIETRTDLTLTRVEVSCDPFGAVAVGRSNAELAFGLAHQRLDRRIRASMFAGALSEVLSSSQIGLRARYTTSISISDRPAEMAVRLEGWWPFRQGLSVDSGGVFDTFGLEPARRASLRVEGSVALRLDAAMTLRAGVGASWLRFGNSAAVPVYSAGVPAGVALYPGSRQRLRTVEVQWQWAFDKPAI